MSNFGYAYNASNRGAMGGELVSCLTVLPCKPAEILTACLKKLTKNFVWVVFLKKTPFSQFALVPILISVLLPFTVQAQSNDTFRLYFDLNVPTLNANTEKRIDLLIYNNKIIDGNNINIVGYADYLGSEEHNKTLSVERSNNVKTYLVHHGINAKDIKLCVGKGQVNRNVAKDKDGYPTDRRVDIVVSHEIKKAPETPTKDGGATNKKDTPIIIRKVILSDLAQMSNLKPGYVIVLNNVYFPSDRHIIKQESYATLEKLYNVLNDNPKLKISIEGHVCCIPPDAPDAFDIDTGEPTLSVNRAKAIYDFLVKKGIDESRLQYQGFGKSHPVVFHEQNEEDAEKNRRVEIRIVENK